MKNYVITTSPLPEIDTSKILDYQWKKGCEALHGMLRKTFDDPKYRAEFKQWKKEERARKKLLREQAQAAEEEKQAREVS